MLFFHGTSASSAHAILRGDPLDVRIAASLHIDGEPGFYLASEIADAEFFAVRRPEGGVVLTFDIGESAIATLLTAGGVQRSIPGGRPPYFTGDELVIPTSAFGVFNERRAEGEIHVSD